jgi:hypothetical protein
MKRIIHIRHSSRTSSFTHCIPHTIPLSPSTFLTSGKPRILFSKSILSSHYIFHTLPRAILKQRRDRSHTQGQAVCMTLRPWPGFAWALTLPQVSFYHVGSMQIAAVFTCCLECTLLAYLVYGSCLYISMNIHLSLSITCIFKHISLL